MRHIAIAALFCVMHAAAAQSDEPSLGVWKMNRDKSTGDLPYSVALKVERAGNGLRHTFEGLSRSGRPFKIQYTAYFDGQDWPITGNPWANSASFRRIGARASERTDKLNGRLVQTVLLVVSEDGRSMTATLNPSGTVAFYEKQ